MGRGILLSLLLIASALGQPSRDAPSSPEPAAESIRGTIEDELLDNYKVELYAKLLGFAHMQLSVLDRIATERPELQESALAIKAKYEKHFGPGIDEIARRLTNKFGDWEPLIEPAVSENAERVLAKADALGDWLESVGKAVDGAIPNGYYSAFLAFNPDNICAPAREMQAGFNVETVFDGDLAEGPTIRFSIPFSWRLTTDPALAEQKHKRQFLSLLGCGPHNLTTIVALREENAPSLDEMAKGKGLAERFPSLKIIRAERADVGGHPALVREYTFQAADESEYPFRMFDVTWISPPYVVSLGLGGLDGDAESPNRSAMSVKEMSALFDAVLETSVLELPAGGSTESPPSE